MYLQSSVDCGLGLVPRFRQKDWSLIDRRRLPSRLTRDIQALPIWRGLKLRPTEFSLAAKEPLVENDGFVFVDEDAVLQVPGNCLGQSQLFQVSPFAYEIANVVAMGYLGHGLMDNGALVKIGGGVVGRGPDELDPLFVSLVVGLGAGEGGKKGVMDIDNGLAEGSEEDAGQNLHVSSHDYQLDPVLFE